MYIPANLILRHPLVGETEDLPVCPQGALLLKALPSSAIFTATLAGHPVKERICIGRSFLANSTGADGRKELKWVETGG